MTNIFKIFFAFSSLIIIYILFNQFEFDYIFEKLDFNLIISIFALSLFSFVNIFFRFNYLMNNFLSNKRNFKTVFDIFINSIVFSQLPIPGFSEVYKYYDISNLTQKREKSAYFLLLERFSGLAASITLILILLNILIFFEYKNYFVNFFVTEIIFMFLLGKFYKKFFGLTPYFNYIYLYLRTEKKIKKTLTIIFSFSILSQIISLTISYLALSIFYNHALIFKVILFIQISNIIVSLPIFFSGFGAREGLYALIFNTFEGVNLNYSIIAASIINTITLLNLVLILLIFKIYKFYFR